MVFLLQPEGAASRCLDCSIEPSCPWSAKKIYITPAKLVNLELKNRHNFRVIGWFVLKDF